jgi:nitric oxide reductase NorQ protein
MPERLNAAPSLEAPSLGARRPAPFYRPVADEADRFRAAWRAGLPILLKGPTGCGKTRLVEAMAHEFGRRLYTVSCHEDITVGDLVGRYVLVEDETVWVDGPLTRAVTEGAICYLDEIVEARQDVTVVIHSLADHRRELYLERRGGVVHEAADGFGLVVSYNPGYQSILKDLKPSTRQRMVSIELGFPPPEVEVEIVAGETGIDDATARDLVRLGQAVRGLEGAGLKEFASTRTLVNAAALVRQGLSLPQAASSAIVGPLTDDADLRQGLEAIVSSYLSG